MKKLTLSGAMAFAACYLAYMTVYILRVNLSVAGTVLQEQALLNAAQFGLLGSVFSVIYAAGRLINGSLSDRIRPEYMIAIGLPMAGIGNLLFAQAGGYSLRLIGWAVNAAGQSMLWSSLLYVMLCIYGNNDKAKRANAYLVTSIVSGNIVSIFLTSYLIENVSLRSAFLVPAVIAFAVAAIAFAAVQPATFNRFTPKTDKSTAERGRLFILLGKDGSLRAMLSLAAMHGVIKENVTLWMTVIIMGRYGLNIRESAMYILLIPLIGLAGRLLFQPVFTLCRGDERRISFVAFFICLIASAALCFKGIGPLNSIIALGLIYALMSMINTSMISVFPTRYASIGLMAGVSGLFDFISYLGTAIGSFVYGIAVDRYGYNFIFISWFLLCLISLVILLRLKTVVKTHQNY